MNIWLDPTLFAQSFVLTLTGKHLQEDDGCRPETVYVPTYSNILTFPIPTEADMQDLHMQTFVCVDVLHTQQCSEALWLVCNPTGAGTVAVIDTDLYMLLTYFHSPRTLQDVRNSPFENPVQIAQAVAILTRLGFLRDLDEPPLL